MLRRLLFITLICATAAGPAFGAEQGATAGCGDGGTATSACVMQCACIVSNVPVLQGTAPALARSMYQAAPIAETVSPPDPAPPKR
jgi:hypothetical protein